VSAKSRGTARENQVLKQLRADGWLALRAPASLGSADIIALRDGDRPMLVQVKANKGSPWMNFRPAERVELVMDATKAGARAYLVHWPARGVQRWLPPSSWPT
jgi:Holliday junction resolvase